LVDARDDVTMIENGWPVIGAGGLKVICSSPTQSVTAAVAVGVAVAPGTGVDVGAAGTPVGAATTPVAVQLPAESGAVATGIGVVAQLG
jgi:hypothetical protein